MQNVGQKPFGALSCVIVNISQGYDEDGDYHGVSGRGVHPLYRITNEDQSFVFHGRAFSMKAFINEFAKKWEIDPASISASEDELLRNFAWKLLAHGVQDWLVDFEGDDPVNPSKEEFAAYMQSYGTDSLPRSYEQEFCQEEGVEALLNKFKAEVDRLVAIIDDAWKGKVTVRSLFEKEESHPLAYYSLLELFGHGISPWDYLEPEDFGFESRPELPTQEEPYELVDEAGGLLLKLFLRDHPSENKEDAQ